MHRTSPRLTLAALVALAAVGGSPAVTAADFIDLATVDREVAAFTGAGIGQPGGARAPIDRRMKLASCREPLAVDWYGRTQDTVVIGCPVNGGWRVFVPIAAAQTPQERPAPNLAARPAAKGSTVVTRGETVAIAVSGAGFTLTRQGQAMDAGAVGDWIRVKPQGNKADPIRARIIRAGMVGMELPS